MRNKNLKKILNVGRGLEFISQLQIRGKFHYYISKAKISSYVFFSALHRLPRDHFIWEKKMFVFSLFEANKSQLHIFLHILEHCVLTQPAVGIAITFGVNTFRISDDIIYFLGEKFSSLLLQKIIIITLNTMERVQNSWNSLFERMLWSFFGKISNVNFFRPIFCSNAIFVWLHL